MSELLSHADFEKYVNQRFRLAIEDLSMELELIECRKIPTAQPIPEGTREPFSLVFRGPMEPELVQHIFPLEHAEMGKLDIFLVPIGPDEKGMKYESVFA